MALQRRRAGINSKYTQSTYSQGPSWKVSTGKLWPWRLSCIEGNDDGHLCTRGYRIVVQHLNIVRSNRGAPPTPLKASIKGVEYQRTTNLNSEVKPWWLRPPDAYFSQFRSWPRGPSRGIVASSRRRGKSNNLSKPLIGKVWEIIRVKIIVTLGPSGPNPQNQSQKCDA